MGINIVPRTWHQVSNHEFLLSLHPQEERNDNIQDHVAVNPKWQEEPKKYYAEAAGLELRTKN